MKLPVDIRFVGLAPSEAVETAARERIGRVEKLCADLMGWRITIEQPHRHQQQGREFSVRIAVTLAGHELAVERVSDQDVYVALRDAFDAMRRRIEDTVRVRRGDVKTHAPGASGP